MIRTETATDWILVTHPDHAKLAGQVADAWGNALFARPEPWEAIRHAIYHHDDGWLNRDSSPILTAQNQPEAFTRELVGAYSAFEEIDLPAYLKVRGEATARVAADNEVAGVLTSMHTVNLLTEQADVATIKPEHRCAHSAFVQEQQHWQSATVARLGLDQKQMQRGFEFLQCCDSLSLIVCSGYDQPRPLRHHQLDQSGFARELSCRPVEPQKWQIDPWPFSGEILPLELPYRSVPKADCTDQQAFASAFAQAEVQIAEITLL